MTEWLSNWLAFFFFTNSASSIEIKFVQTMTRVLAPNLSHFRCSWKPLNRSRLFLHSTSKTNFFLLPTGKSGCRYLFSRQPAIPLPPQVASNDMADIRRLQGSKLCPQRIQRSEYLVREVLLILHTKYISKTIVR